MFDSLFIARSVGALGLFCISAGVLQSENVQRQDELFIVGGVGLLVYSVSLHDPIFIPLQIVFIFSSAYNLYKKSRKSSASL